MTRRKLETIRWMLITTSLALILINWVLKPVGAWAVLWFFSLVVVGIPASALSLHLHPPKWFRHLEQPKR